MSGLKKVFTSSFLLSTEAVLRKLVGLVSTLILARLLVPEDFGLIAIAIMIMGFIDSMKSFGGQKYLLKEPEITPDMINTNWTINSYANWFLITIMLLVEPLISGYYEDERLTNVIRAFALIWFIRSWGNPGLIYLKREQNYLPIVKLSIATKIIAVIAVIISAFTLKSYWALVIGQLTTYSLNTLGGYFLHSHRPRFCLKGFKKQWNFSSWWTLQNILGYWKAHLDTFLVSSFFDKTVLGSYHTIKYFSAMPITFLLQPASQPLLVALSKLKDNKNYFGQQLNITFIIMVAISAPIAIFCISHHLLVTQVLLGENWVEYSYLFGIFCISIVAYAFMRQATEVLVIFGKTKVIFNIQLITFFAVYGTLLLYPLESIAEFSIIKVSIESILGIIAFLAVSIYFTSFANVISSLFAIIPVCIAIVLALLLTIETNLNLHPFFQLSIKVINFFAVYILSLLILGFMMSKTSNEWKYLFNLTSRFLSTNLLKKVIK